MAIQSYASGGAATASAFEASIDNFYKQDVQSAQPQPVCLVKTDPEKERASQLAMNEAHGAHSTERAQLTEEEALQYDRLAAKAGHLSVGARWGQAIAVYANNLNLHPSADHVGLVVISTEALSTANVMNTQKLTAQAREQGLKKLETLENEVQKIAAKVKDYCQITDIALVEQAKKRYEAAKAGSNVQEQLDATVHLAAAEKISNVSQFSFGRARLQAADDFKPRAALAVLSRDTAVTLIHEEVVRILTTLDPDTKVQLERYGNLSK